MRGQRPWPSEITARISHLSGWPTPCSLPSQDHPPLRRCSPVPASVPQDALLDDDSLSAFGPSMATPDGGLCFVPSPAASEPFPCLADELEQEAQLLEVQW